MIVFGVWDHGWEYDDLMGLYWKREDAEAAAAKNENLEVEEIEIKGSAT